MSSFTNYLNYEILDQIFGGADYAESGNHYIALSTGTGNVIAEDGTSFLEPTGYAYARVSVGNNKSEWSVATGDGDTEVHNRSGISFTTATGPWGTIADYGIYDIAATGLGNLLGFGALTTPQSIANNNTVSFASGALSITLN